MFIYNKIIIIFMLLKASNIYIFFRTEDKRYIAEENKKVN